MKKLSLLLVVGSVASMLHAQQPDTTIVERFSVHAQTTVINQYKPAFHVAYSGENSLRATSESQTSLTSTLYLGARLWKGASAYFNPEIAGGSGLSGALGIGAATNGETFRVGDPAPKIYLARLFFRQVFSLCDATAYQAGDLNQLAERLPLKYLSLTVGKIGVADYFDDNSYSHDPRTQFLSWALMDNGAWDYPANTRGYTPSVVLEWVTPTNEWRYAASMLPLTANANEMNTNVAKASSHSLEYTHRYRVQGQEGAVRLLTFYSRANMGNYRTSATQHTSVEDTRAEGRTKYGIAINAEQNLTRYLGCFARASWNDGKNETWCFTEIDRSLSGGLSLDGAAWRRDNDNVGLAYVVSGLSKDHRDYLASGGTGFMLGDGAINYAPEHLTELYYSCELKNNIYLTGSYQFLGNPGYNKDRSGPVHVFSVRLHVEI